MKYKQIIFLQFNNFCNLIYLEICFALHNICRVVGTNLLPFRIAITYIECLITCF